MKKYLTMVTTAMLLLTGCNKESEVINTSKTDVDDKVVELIPDNKFERGFNAYPGNKSFDDGTYPEDDWTDNVYLKYTSDTPSPLWQLQQMGCIYDLNDVYNPLTSAYPSYEDGYYKFEGVSNYVHVNPSIGKIILGLNASKEYQHARKDRENWPHLLLQNVLNESVQIKDLSELTFSTKLKISCENKMKDSEFNSSLHTAQFILYFIVNTTNEIDSGEFFYFGVPFYDYRYKGVMKESVMIDNGTSGNTGKAIYQMDTSFLGTQGFILDHDYDINLDLVSCFADALLKVQSLDRMTNTSVDDLIVTNMNVGFELPGTFDVKAEIQDFSLKAVRN